MITNEEWENFIKTLRVLNKHPEEALDEMTMKGLVANLYKKHRKKARAENQEEIREHDRRLKETTVRCQMEVDFQNIKLLPSSGRQKLKKPIMCYTCKQMFTELDEHYHLLCPECSELNHKWRHREVDLKGRRFLVTGGRVKIGYHAVLRLLECGAEVIVTTRFPDDAGQRFRKEPGWAEWGARLMISGLDLRDLKGIKSLIDNLVSAGRHLDGIISNAAQTVRRPDDYYRNLITLEQKADENYNSYLHNRQKLLSTKEVERFFPARTFDSEGLPADLRDFNSWLMNLEQVPFDELVEVLMINTIAPFLLNTQLKPLLMKSPFEERFIVNVSAVEGQFNYNNKTPRHPHTNMAKAALNMMTRTAAHSYINDGIYMNSVDTGWITQENPFPKKQAIRESGFVPPLDVHDGAARIIAPVFDGVEGELYYGHFLKDYKVVDW